MSEESVFVEITLTGNYSEPVVVKNITINGTLSAVGVQIKSKAEDVFTDIKVCRFINSN